MLVANTCSAPAAEFVVLESAIESAIIAGKVDNGGPDTVFIDGIVYVKAASINYLLHERATVFAMLLLAGVLAGFVAGMWVML